jgi:hypothetical protein
MGSTAFMKPSRSTLCDQQGARLQKLNKDELVQEFKKLQNETA